MDTISDGLTANLDALRTVKAAGAIATDLFEYGEEMADRAARRTPASVVRPGGQVEMFFGPCIHCGVGHVPHLPAKCPNCGVKLRRMVHLPRPRGPYWYRFLRIYLFIVYHATLSNLRNAIPHIIQDVMTAVIDITDRTSRTAAVERGGR